MAENHIDCPHCAETIQLNAILCRFCQQGISAEHFIACPLCAEMVRKGAVTCRYCGASPTTGDSRGGRASILKSAEIVQAILGQLRLGGSLDSVLELAVYSIARGSESHRCLILQTIGDEFVFTHEYDKNGQACFVGTKFDAEESGAILAELLSRFPDQSAQGVLFVSNVPQDSALHTVSPRLTSLMELGNVCSTILVPLSYRHMIFGFIILQQKDLTPLLHPQDISTLGNIAVLLACVIQLNRSKQ